MKEEGKKKDRKRIGSSISIKMTAIIVICILALSLSFALITSAFMDNILTDNAASHMTLFCEDQGSDINDELKSVESEVQSLSTWSESRIKSIYEIKEDRERRREVLRDAEDLMHFAADGNRFVKNIYMHYTLDITGSTESIESVYLSRDSEGILKNVEYPQSYIESDPVAQYWYYDPIDSGAPMWTEPYYDEEVDDYIISYVTPVIVDDRPVMIIGIDISFSTLIDYVSSIKYHDTGYMYLKARDGSVHYHPSYLAGEDVHGDEQDNAFDEDGLLSQPNSEGRIIRYEYRGGDRTMVFMTLRNGMKLVLCDSYEEIFSDRILAVRVMAVIAVILAVIFVTIMFILTSRVVIKPITRLSQATARIGEGDYDITLPRESDDEIGDLTRSFNIAISNIRQRAEDIRSHVEMQEEKIRRDEEVIQRKDSDLTEMKSIAYSDALTGVKNKAAYDETISFINGQIKKGTASFAVVMCDLNYLKMINDKKGHHAGDKALIGAAKLLCGVFPMSAVFRIGGDEFVILPYGAEYDNLSEMLEKLGRLIDKEISSTDIVTDRLSIAFGSAVYDPDKDKSFEDVFERADSAMYENKHMMHKKDGYSER